MKTGSESLHSVLVITSLSYHSQDKKCPRKENLAFWRARLVTHSIDAFMLNYLKGHRSKMSLQEFYTMYIYAREVDNLLEFQFWK